MIEACILLGTLGVHSIEDYKEKQITVTITLFSAIFGILLHLMFHQRSLYEMLAGVLSGAAVLALGFLTGWKIGPGDGIVFMLTGLYLGAAGNLALMMLSFSMAGIFGIFLLAVKKCGRNERIPLVPFLFFGCCILMLGRGICV